MKEGLKKVWHFVKYSTWLKYAAVAVNDSETGEQTSSLEANVILDVIL